MSADTVSAGLLQSQQRDFDQENWQHAAGRDTVRHVLLHLTKLTGKLAAVVEVWDHGGITDEGIIDAEIIPDLLHNAWRLANDRDISAADVAEMRWDVLRDRNRARLEQL